MSILFIVFFIIIVLVVFILKSTIIGGNIEDSIVKQISTLSNEYYRQSITALCEIIDKTKYSLNIRKNIYAIQEVKNRSQKTLETVIINNDEKFYRNKNNDGDFVADNIRFIFIPASNETSINIEHCAQLLATKELFYDLHHYYLSKGYKSNIRSIFKNNKNGTDIISMGADTFELNYETTIIKHTRDNNSCGGNCASSINKADLDILIYAKLELDYIQKIFALKHDISPYIITLLSKLNNEYKLNFVNIDKYIKECDIKSSIENEFVTITHKDDMDKIRGNLISNMHERQMHIQPYLKIGDSIRDVCRILFCNEINSSNIDMYIEQARMLDLLSTTYKNKCENMKKHEKIIMIRKNDNIKEESISISHNLFNPREEIKNISQLVHMNKQKYSKEKGSYTVINEISFKLGNKLVKSKFYRYILISTTKDGLTENIEHNDFDIKFLTSMLATHIILIL